MSTITYKCPSCAGRLEFSSTTQTMICPFCDSSYTVESLASLDDAINASAAQAAEAAAQVAAGAAGAVGAAAAAGSYPPPTPRTDWIMPSQTWEAGEQDDMHVFTCKTCAGAIVADSTMSSTSCPYCGNPIVITERFSGTLKPDVVIPFKLTKEDAKRALQNHYKDKPFLPNFFTDDNRLNEVKGVYVPFWLFDATYDADAIFDCTKVRSYSDSKYNYTETSHYEVRRTGSVDFMHVPVDGSIQLADDLMESIEPFDYTQLTLFQTAYLAGFSANVYDVTAQNAVIRAQDRMRETAEEVVKAAVTGYDSTSLKQLNSIYYNPRCTYALLPVWLLSSTFEGKIYTFAMNGQTGRLVGDLPVDKSKVQSRFIKVTSIIAAVLTAISMIAGWMGGY